jgi:hypothetical protein
VTAGSGSCTLTSAALSPTTPSTVFTLTNLSGTSMIYDASENLAVQITINKP